MSHYYTAVHCSLSKCTHSSPLPWQTSEGIHLAYTYENIIVLCVALLINSSLSLSLSLSLSPCLQSMTLPDDLPIVVNFTKISLKPGLKYVRVASLSFFVNSSTPGGKSSGMIKIWGEDHTSFYHVQVPYEAHIMKGYVESLPSPLLSLPLPTYKMYFILLQYFCYFMCTHVLRRVIIASSLLSYTITYHLSLRHTPMLLLIECQWWFFFFSAGR